MRGRWISAGLALALGITAMLAPTQAMAAVGKEDHTLIDYTSAPGWPEAPDTDAECVFAIELNSGAVLYSKAADEPVFPASTTKTITAKLALENCELDEEVTYSYAATHNIEQGGQHYEFKEGEVLTVDESIQALLVESVNEAAYALAEHVSGNVTDFVQLMNEKAVEWGATNTHFNNPHGLNDENHKTTAHDMAMILWACIQDARFQQYADIQSINLKGHEIQTSGFPNYINHHEMILYGGKHYDTDVVCGKTGFTSIAGSTLVTYGHRNDMDVIVVIMKGEDQERFVDTKKVLDYAFDNFELVSADEVNRSLMDTGIGSVDLGTYIEAGQVLLLPKNGGTQKLTSEFVPAETGTEEGVLGTRNWFYDGAACGSSKVMLGTAESTAYVSTGEESSSGQTIHVGGGSKAVLFGLNKVELILVGVLVVILIALIAILLRLIYVSREKKRRRRRRQMREAQRRERDYPGRR